MSDKFHVSLKADQKDPVEVKNGSIYLKAAPGDVLEVDFRAFTMAMSSGLFEKASAPKKSDAKK